MQSDIKINWGNGHRFSAEGEDHIVWQDPHYNVIKEEIMNESGTEITFSIIRGIKKEEYKTERELLESLCLELGK